MPSDSDTSLEYSTLRPFGAKGPAETYDRFLVRYRRSRLTAQVIVISPGRVEMSVHAHPQALEVDFKLQQVIDPDSVETYLRRPGFYLQRELQRLRDQRKSAILFNGNNIGYWGNQYVIHDHELQYKRRGPIFDNGDLVGPAHTGEHAFFIADDSGFCVQKLSLVGRGSEGRTLEDLAVQGRSLPRFGLSGFPLISEGKPVWREYGPWAWDPGLLFDLGRIPPDWTVTELRDHVIELLASGDSLARHPMTVLGIDKFGQAVLMVVERSDDSRGMTVEEAADLLRRRFGVREAIVLGAAGDAQLATTEEGFLTEPLVASHARPSAETVPATLLYEPLRNRLRSVQARPVPCYVQFDLVAAADMSPRRLRPSAKTFGMT